MQLGCEILFSKPVNFNYLIFTGDLSISPSQTSDFFKTTGKFRCYKLPFRLLSLVVCYEIVVNTRAKTLVRAIIFFKKLL